MGCSGSKAGGEHDFASGRPLGRPFSRDHYYANHRNLSTRHVARVADQPPPLPSLEGAKTEEEKQVLHVTSLDLRVTENVRFHRTTAYDATAPTRPDQREAQLIVRRGQPFDVTLRIDRAFEQSRDSLRVVLDAGSRPRESHGSRIVLELQEKDSPRRWGARLLASSADSRTLNLRVSTPPMCAVAAWTLHVDVSINLVDRKRQFRHTHDQKVYIIFNPWCQDDQVYLDDELSRQEYVLNEKGRIYQGTKQNVQAKPWNYGQFEDFVLDVALFLLDQSEISWRVRSNAVFVVRKLASLVASPDDAGVLVSNFTADHSLGTSPLRWTGSIAILYEFWKTRRPVRYSHCYVVSAVMTSLCRSLGIPSRTVTAYDAAHDCDGSLTIDSFWNKSGLPQEDLNSERLWNFHSWNDVWMARPDLPAGFGGWQVVNATPQETSDGVNCTGPASLEALKNGLVNLPYDGAFAFAEINAERLHWIQNANDEWTKIREEHASGRLISTKDPQNFDRMDITYMYKFTEGSQMEKSALWRAEQEGSTRKQADADQAEDLCVELLQSESFVYGQPVNIAIDIHNKSLLERNVRATVSATTLSYTGVSGKLLKAENLALKIPASADGCIRLVLKPHDYLFKLFDMAHLKISCFGQVAETEQFFCRIFPISLEKPEIKVLAPKEVMSGSTFDAEISFTNPLNKTLKHCEFGVEGASLITPVRLKHGSVSKKGDAKASLKMAAKRHGLRELIVSFESKEIGDITGCAQIKVLPTTSSLRSHNSILN